MINRVKIRSRILAGMIDYFVIYGFLLIFFYFLGEQNPDGGYTLSGIKAFLPILIWFLFTVILESGFGGTLGNSLMSLKAIPESKQIRNLSFSESFKRHLLDPIDMFCFGIVGYLNIKNSDLNQRLGDKWAKTIVVKTEDFNNSLIEKTI